MLPYIKCRKRKYVALYLIFLAYVCITFFIITKLQKNTWIVKCYFTLCKIHWKEWIWLDRWIHDLRIKPVEQWLSFYGNLYLHSGQLGEWFCEIRFLSGANVGFSYNVSLTMQDFWTSLIRNVTPPICWLSSVVVNLFLLLSLLFFFF